MWLVSMRHATMFCLANQECLAGKLQSYLLVLTSILYNVQNHACYIAMSMLTPSSSTPILFILADAVLQKGVYSFFHGRKSLGCFQIHAHARGLI